MQSHRATSQPKAKRKRAAAPPPKPSESSRTSEPAGQARAAMTLRETHNVTRGQQWTNGVGLISVGVGLFGLVAPGSVAALVGAQAHGGTRRWIQGAALGQLATGIGVLSSRHPAPWLWSRVLTDVVGLGLLALKMGLRSPPPRGAVIAGAGLMGLAALGGVAAQRAKGAARTGSAHGIYVNASVTIQRSPQEVYAAWRDLQHLPRFMTHLSSVKEENGEVQLHAELPGGFHLQWRARITEDLPNTKLAWISLPGAQVQNHGAVSFSEAPGGRGTQVHLTLNYEPLGGAIGHAFMKLFGALPLEQIRGDLRRFKQILETGTLVHSDASIHKGPHPARPAENSQELAEERSQGGM